MSAAYEIAKVAVPAAAVAIVAGTFVMMMRRADKKSAKDKPQRGWGGGDIGYVTYDDGAGHHGGHGGHSHHGGDGGGGHDGGGGGHP